MTPERPGLGLATEVADLAWMWARREFGLAPDEPPFSQWETLPPERARMFCLNLLHLAFFASLYF